MRKPGPLGRYAVILAALSFATPCLAAGKRGKAKRATPARESRAEPKNAEVLPAPVEQPPASPPDAAPDSQAAAAEEPAAPESAVAPEPASPSKLPTPREAERAASEPDGVVEVTGALERRERLRLASGRVEVAAFVGAGAGGRSFRYSDAIGRLLAPYRLAVAPMVTFELEAYPLASTNIPGLRDVGFRGRVSRAFAVNSKTPDGATIDTSWTRFGGELRYRLLVPGRHRFEAGILAGADADDFAMSTVSKVAALVPSARVVSARFGFDAELLVASRFSVLLGGSYLLKMSASGIYDRFRGARVAGVDANLGFALGLAPGVSARLCGNYTRYFSSFAPQVGDPAVAGGALDQQWQGSFGVRYAH